MLNNILYDILKEERFSLYFSIYDKHLLNDYHDILLSK